MGNEGKVFTTTTSARVMLERSPPVLLLFCGGQAGPQL